MKQELPQLVDERRFRRREQEQHVERDEFGRVSGTKSSNCSPSRRLTADSANGRRRKSPLVSSRSLALTSVHKLLDTAEPMSSISSRKLVAECRSRAADQAIWRLLPAERATRTCSCTSRKFFTATLSLLARSSLAHTIQGPGSQDGRESQGALRRFARQRQGAVRGVQEQAASWIWRRRLRRSRW